MATVASFGTPKTCREGLKAVKMAFGKDLSKQWWSKFLKRHSDRLETRKPKKTKPKRMRGTGLRVLQGHCGSLRFGANVLHVSWLSAWADCSG